MRGEGNHIRYVECFGVDANPINSVGQRVTSACIPTWVFNLSHA